MEKRPFRFVLNRIVRVSIFFINRLESLDSSSTAVNSNHELAIERISSDNFSNTYRSFSLSARRFPNVM